MTTRKIAAALAAAAFSLAAVACGSDGNGGAQDDASADVGDSTGTAATAEGSSDDSSSTADLDPDGVLHIATFAIYPWDPDTVDSGFAITTQALVFDRLVHTEPDGGLVPGLATGWEPRAARGARATRRGTA